MASEAANVAACKRFPGLGLPTPSSATKGLRDAYAEGYDAGKAQANREAGWSTNYDQGVA